MPNECNVCIKGTFSVTRGVTISKSEKKLTIYYLQRSPSQGHVYNLVVNKALVIVPLCVITQKLPVNWVDIYTGNAFQTSKKTTHLYLYSVVFMNFCLVKVEECCMCL